MNIGLKRYCIRGGEDGGAEDGARLSFLKLREPFFALNKIIHIETLLKTVVSKYGSLN